MTNLPILIIDDESAVRKGLKMLLALNGLQQPQTAESYEKGIQYLDSTSMVLLDITMPGTDGVTALSKIKISHPELPVVMVTGISDIQTAVNCMKLGARDYLTKPVDEKQLLNCVRSVLAIDTLIKHSEKTTTEFTPPEIPLRAGDQFESICSWAESLFTISTNAVQTQQSALFEQFREFILKEENFSDSDISVRTVANYLGTNESTLSKIVNSGFSVNFRTLVNRLRLAAFVRHVKNDVLENMTIEGVAAIVGFERPSTFYSVFKAESGCTPREWLNNTGEIKILI